MKGSDQVISVIVPVYNASEDLRRCVDSIAGQSWKDLEIILIDDGSTDGSGALCDSLAATDARIRVIHQKNQGVSTARNAGLQMAVGEYIGFVDSDDYIAHNMFETMVKKANDEKADIVFCGFVEHRESGIQYERIPKKIGIVDSTEALSLCFRDRGCFTAVWNKLFHRKCFLELDAKPHEFCTDLFIGEDELWLTEALMKAETVAILPDLLYSWCWRANSAVHQQCINDKKLSALESKRRVLDILQHEEPALVNVCQVHFYNTWFGLMELAYLSKDHVREKVVWDSIKIHRYAWLKAKNISLQRKIRLEIIRILMQFRVRHEVVSFFSRLKREL